jgi:hypothetical protein
MNNGWIKKGQKLSAETIEKIRISHTGKTSGMKGKKHSDKTKNKMSKKHKGFRHKKESIEKMSGDNNWQWKGGVSKDGCYISWIKNKRNRLKTATIKQLGSHTFGEWELLKKQYNNTCPCCGLSEPFNQRSKYLTEDHIIPLSKGGSDLIENIQPLCSKCNSIKNSKIIRF